LSKSYDGILALDNVDLAIDRGTVFGLLGPNGAGKTTLIRILSGLLAYDSGEVSVLDADPRERQEGVLTRLGVLLEDASPYPQMTPERYLGFFSALYFPGEDRREQEKRVEHCLRRVDLQDLRGVRISSLSHGMKKRLLFARALINDPELIILDEPLAGLDPVASSHLKGILRQLNSEGRTIIVSTHILGDAEDLCRTIGILHKGRLLFHGRLDDARREFAPRRLRVSVTRVNDPLVKTLESLSYVARVTAEGDESLILDIEDVDLAKARETINDMNLPEVLALTSVPVGLDEMFLSMVEGEGT
jgi:ABC-type multidrug transport system ATPase subunit